MNRKIHLSLFIVIICLFVTACEKPEQGIELPPKGKSQHATVDMGEDYTDQLFFDFESGSVVYTSLVNSWDLAFETSPMGYHVFMNGGMKLCAYNTHATDMAKVKTPPNIKEGEWSYDISVGVPDSTGIGEWQANGKSKNHVYILMSDATANFKYKKIQLVAVTDKEYIFSYADLESEDVKTIPVPKDNNYNYTYFSFKAGIVQPEPPKNTWDIVFTRYRYIYYIDGIFPYMVSGGLMNPYNTTGVADSSVAFENMNSEILPKLAFSNFRDIIGFSWKQYDIGKGKYSVNPRRNFIIRNRNGQYWKLHFLDFYSKDGVKGSPSFEYERFQ